MSKLMNDQFEANMNELPKVNDEEIPEKETGFLFLPSFRESFELIRKMGDDTRAYLLLEAIVMYGTKGIRITDDPLICAVMASIERSIDSGKQKRRKKLKKESAQEKEKLGEG